jgi:hypothetical protein
VTGRPQTTVYYIKKQRLLSIHTQEKTEETAVFSAVLKHIRGHPVFLAGFMRLIIAILSRKLYNQYK